MLIYLEYEQNHIGKPMVFTPLCSLLKELTDLAPLACSLRKEHSQLSTICLFLSILFYTITLESRRSTTDEFATIPFHLDLFSAALVELAKSIPVHSLILSSHFFVCLPLFLFPFTVTCMIVFAKPKNLKT